jgi:hypothetical protein
MAGIDLVGISEPARIKAGLPAVTAPAKGFETLLMAS